MAYDLADRIYEAAFVPDLWPGVLDDMVGLSASVSGSVCVLLGLDRPPLYRTTALTREILDEFVSTDRWRLNRRGAVILDQGLAHRLGGFTYADTYMSDEQDKACSIAQSLREHGLGEQLHTAVPLPNGATVIYTLERQAGDGRHAPERIAAMNGLRSHLVRAGQIVSRLALEQATATVAALQALALAACVLDRSGKVLAANDSFGDLDDLFVTRAFGTLALADPTADYRLQAAIAALEPATIRSALSTSPHAPSSNAVHIVHVVPLYRSAHDIFAGADLMLIVDRVDRALGIPADTVVSALFDLSPAEARLATHLATGASLSASAARSGITIKTARTYLERIFRKTGTHRQGELIALLRSAHSLRRSP